MLCISLWQPWATLLVTGHKRVETRGWPLRHRGPLLIHAAKRFDQEQANICTTEPFLSALLGLGCLTEHAPTPEFCGPLHDVVERAYSFDIPTGCLVGRVDVVECYPTERVGRWEQTPGEPDKNYFLDNIGIMGPGDGKPYLFVSDTERAFGDYAPGRWAWLCANAVRFETPVPYRGMQRLFDVPADTLKAAGVTE